MRSPLLLCSLSLMACVPMTIHGSGSHTGGGLPGVNQNIVGEFDPWGSAGRPTVGNAPAPLQFASMLTQPGIWKQSAYDYGIRPRDTYAPKTGESFVKDTQATDVYLDRDGAPEKAVFVQTYSGENFVAIFAPTDDEQSWVYLGTFALPNVAKDPQCRAKGDGIFRLQGANMVKNAPQFLWVEIQHADLAAAQATKRDSLHLYALVNGSLGPIFEETLTRDQYGKAGGPKDGEQISYAVKLDERKGGLLLKGQIEQYTDGVLQPSGGATELWYYFDGRKYTALSSQSRY